jgi:multicomponent Na+:H+ antiporter subunit A
MTYLLLCVPLLCLALLFFAQPLVGTTAGTWAIDWVKALELTISFEINPLANLFALVIAFIGFWVYFYGIQYMKKYEGTGRFWFFLSAFMISMLGLVMADNLIAIFVFWEFTSICSYFLIGFFHEKEESRDSALMALLVTGLGGIVLLGGFIIIGVAGGGYDISTLMANQDRLLAHPHAQIGLILVFIGAATKSAQFPFHFWLPNAMAAPAPVSSFLHSATMVKAGVFLMARLFPLLSDLPLWTPLLSIVGGLTFVWGGFIAITEYDLKSILAHTTISALGFLIMLLGLGDDYSLKAFCLFFLAHAFYKAPLFMAAGIIEKRYGTRDIRELGQGLKDDWTLSLAMMIAAISMMGLPPAVGFLAKEAGIEGVLSHPMALTTIVIGAVVNFVAALKICQGVLFGKTKKEKVYEPGLLISIGPFVLATTGLLLGVLTFAYEDLLVAQVLAYFTGVEHNIHLALWHGLNAPLAVSAVAITLGLLTFKFLGASEALVKMVRKLDFIAPSKFYSYILNGTLKLAALFTDNYQSGYLRRYQMIIMIAASGLMASSIIQFAPQFLELRIDFNLVDVFLGSIMIFAACASLITETKIWVIALLGIVGINVVLFFVIYGAPDLALTQLLVEIFTLAIFVFALNKLPEIKTITPAFLRSRDVAISIFAGILFSFLTYLSFTTNIQDTYSSYFAENSYLLAHGKNIVNVILVDFRGFDTLGEIAVLLMASVGVYILLKKNKGAKDHE